MNNYISASEYSPNSGNYQARLNQQYPYRQYPQERSPINRPAELEIPKRSIRRTVRESSSEHSQFSYPQPRNWFSNTNNYQEYQAYDASTQAQTFKKHQRSPTFFPVKYRSAPSQSIPNSPAQLQYSPSPKRSESKGGPKKDNVLEVHDRSKQAVKEKTSPRVEDLIYEKEKPVRTNSSLNSLMKPFRVVSGSSEDHKKKGTCSQKPQYRHRNDSEDNIELMPTLAKGYENSVEPGSKELRSEGSNSELLRITEDGYYFNERASSDLDSKPPKYHIHQSYLQPGEDPPFEYYAYDDQKGLVYGALDEGKLDTRSIEPIRNGLPSVYNNNDNLHVSLKKHLEIEAENVQENEKANISSDLKQPDFEKNTKSPFLLEPAASDDADMEKKLSNLDSTTAKELSVEQPNIDVPKRKRRLLKKVFFLEPKAKITSTQEEERLISKAQKGIISKGKVEQRVISAPVSRKVSPIDIYRSENIPKAIIVPDINLRPHTPTVHVHESLPDASESPRRVQQPPQGEQSPPDMWNNIPIISTVFRMVDESDASDSSKFFVKVLLIVFIFYELQSVIDIFVARA